MVPPPTELLTPTHTHDAMLDAMHNAPTKDAVMATSGPRLPSLCTIVYSRCYGWWTVPCATTLSTMNQERKSSIDLRVEAHDDVARALKVRMVKLLCGWLVVLPTLVAVVFAALINSWQHPIYRVPHSLYTGEVDLYDLQGVNIRVDASLWPDNRWGHKCFGTGKDANNSCSVSWGTIFFIDPAAVNGTIPTPTAVYDPKNIRFSYGQWVPLQLSENRYEEEGFDLVPPINWVLLLTATLSFFGSGSVIGSFIYYKELQKNYSLRLVFFMAFADLGFSCKFLMSSIMILTKDLSVINNGIYGKGDQIEGACIASGLMGQFFGLSTICWNFCIGLNLLLSLKCSFRYNQGSAKKYFRIFTHVFSWGLPLLTCILALAENNVVMTFDGTCWLYGNWVFFFYVPLFIFILVNVYAVGVALVVINPTMVGEVSFNVRHSKPANRTSSFTMSAQQEKQGVESWIRVFNYMLAFISIWIWGMVLRLGTSFRAWNDLGVFNDYSSMNKYETAQPPAWLVFSGAFFLGAGGAINAFIWLEPVTRQGRKKLNKSLRTNMRRASGMVIKSNNKPASSRDVELTSMHASGIPSEV